MRVVMSSLIIKPYGVSGVFAGGGVGGAGTSSAGLPAPDCPWRSFLPLRQTADPVLVCLRQGAEPLAFLLIQQRRKTSREPKSPGVVS